MEKNILVIDNDSLLIDDLLMVLNVLRCCVKTADTGFKGIKMLIEEHFDLVIIDLFASGFDGREVANHIRMNRKNGSPIIVGISDDLNLIEGSGFDRIFTYPLSTNDLVEIQKYVTDAAAVNVKQKWAFL
jgi:CheY-like chemotaxis protein